MAVKRIRKIRQSTSTLSSTASVIDSLTSTSKTDALSANQGKILNDTKLNLTGGTLRNYLNLKIDTVDMTKTDNNITTDIYPSTFNLMDKNDKIMTRLEGIPKSSGEMWSYWYVRNYKTDGTMLAQSGIKLIMDKTGAFHTNIEGDLHLTGQNMISINGHNGILHHGATDTQLTANAGNIYLRPYGYNNTNNQIVVGKSYMTGKLRPIARSVCGNDNTNGVGWYKICSQTLSGYGNTSLILTVKDNYMNHAVGLLNIEIRSNKTSIECWSLKWLYRGNFAYNSAGIVIDGMTWTLYIYRLQQQYGRLTCTENICYNINGNDVTDINYYSSTTKESTTPSFTIRSSDNTPTAYPVTLYNNSSGTTGTVTLGETVANFSYIKIFYKAGGLNSSTLINTSDNNSVCLMTASQEDNNINNYLNCRGVKISGTSITTIHYARSVFYESSNISQATNVVNITKVIGYR